MNKYSEESHINVGSSKEVSIIELANIVKEIVDFKGNITHDLSKPDGTPRKLMDNSKINAMGWKACTELKNGIKEIVNNYNL
jgi:GDP-L-fucose synthase